MRISDWSSDVCSSDLVLHRDRVLERRHVGEVVQEGVPVRIGQLQRRAQQHREHEEHRHVAILEQAERGQPEHVDQRARSEEHTSELQSLMRISYAVFCLKKKKTSTQHENTNHHNKQNTNEKANYI